MKKSSIFTGALIVCLAVLAIVAFGVFNGSVLGYANAEQYKIGDTAFESEIKALEVAWTEGSVQIEFHAGSGVRVSETAKKALTDDTRLHWWLDGTTLRIQYAKSGIRVTGNLGKALTVSLPEGLVLDSAVIRGTSADLNISALAAEDMTLASTSGRIEALVAAKQLKASSTSGDVNIRQRGGSGAVAASSTSGSVILSTEDARDVAVTSTSGSVFLTMAGAAENVKMNSTSGSVTVERLNADKADISSTSGSISVQADALKTLSVSSTSGSVTASLPAVPGYTCRVGTGSGTFSSETALSKDGNTYVCGDGSGAVSIKTTSGSIRILESK